jgi:hypothetical protein
LTDRDPSYVAVLTLREGNADLEEAPSARAGGLNWRGLLPELLAVTDERLLSARGAAPAGAAFVRVTSSRNTVCPQAQIL